MAVEWKNGDRLRDSWCWRHSGVLFAAMFWFGFNQSKVMFIF